MNELCRMQYLDAMGIDTFVPRVVLPFAKAPSLCDLPFAEQNIEIAPPVETSSAQVDVSFVEEKPQARATAGKDVATLARIEVLDRAVATTELSVSVKKAPSIDKSPPDSVARVDSVSFSLASWRVSDRIFVLDSRQAGDALPTHALLGNVLQALSLVNAPLAPAEILHWPLVKGAHDSSWSAAIQMVRGFLDGKLLASPVDYVFLFGADACKSVLGEDIDYATALYGTSPLDEFNCEVVVLPSLTELLYQPLLKKNVWQALKSVTDQLNP